MTGGGWWWCIAESSRLSPGLLLAAPVPLLPPPSSLPVPDYSFYLFTHQYPHSFIHMNTNCQYPALQMKTYLFTKVLTLVNSQLYAMFDNMTIYSSIHQGTYCSFLTQLLGYFLSSFTLSAKCFPFCAHRYPFHPTQSHLYIQLYTATSIYQICIGLYLLKFVEVLSHFHRLFESSPDIQRMSAPFDNFFNRHSCSTSNAQ